MLRPSNTNSGTDHQPPTTPATPEPGGDDSTPPACPQIRLDCPDRGRRRPGSGTQSRSANDEQTPNPVGRQGHLRDDPLPVLERGQQSPLNVFEGHERQLADQLVNKRPEPTESNHAPRTPTPSKPPKRRTKGRAERSSRTSSRLN